MGPKNLPGLSFQRPWVNRGLLPAAPHTRLPPGAFRRFQNLPECSPKRDSEEHFACPTQSRGGTQACKRPRLGPALFCSAVAGRGGGGGCWEVADISRGRGLVFPLPLPFLPCSQSSFVSASAETSLLSPSLQPVSEDLLPSHAKPSSSLAPSASKGASGQHRPPPLPNSAQGLQLERGGGTAGAFLPRPPPAPPHPRPHRCLWRGTGLQPLRLPAPAWLAEMRAGCRAGNQAATHRTNRIFFCN